MSLNPYLEEVHRVLPRILALFDMDPFSPTYGVGDRYRWAWKLIDFGNGTFQGAAHGLARLLAHGLLPERLSEQAILHRIDVIFRGTDFLRYRNGSLEEAFPFESSFCVTALVAFDLLTATELLDGRLDSDLRARYFDIVRPMIRFLHRGDETHGLISNHLATAAAALFKWTKLTNESGKQRGQQLLDRILAGQSSEGWFREYEGADPGYQTLCTYYLADLHRSHPHLGLAEPLHRSLQFLWHFAHPDGSFGGYYGSRNTRFYVPAGIQALAGEFPEADALADFQLQSIRNQSTVTLNCIDEPNLVPMFNAYCWAAALLEEGVPAPQSRTAIPCQGPAVWRRRFDQAGLLVDKGVEHYTIISWHKGGVCYHFAKDPDDSQIDSGIVVQWNGAGRFSTQAMQPTNTLEVEEDEVRVTARLVALRKKLPSPIQFTLLRLLNLSIMRNQRIGRWLKKVLVWYVMTGKKTSSIQNRRTIRLGPRVTIEDAVAGRNKPLAIHRAGGTFGAMHMASSGYWQRQDDAA